MKRFYFGLLFLLISVLGFQIIAESQDAVTKVCVHFSASKPEVRWDYRYNASELQKLKELAEELKTDKSRTISRIVINGYTSLENSHEANLKLSQERAQALDSVIHAYFEVSEDVISYDDEYIPWEWLKERMEASDLPHKASAMAVANSEREMMDFYAGRTLDRRINTLRWMENGSVWQFMKQYFFPYMRRAEASIYITQKDVASEPDPYLIVRKEENINTDAVDNSPSNHAAQVYDNRTDSIILEDPIINSPRLKGYIKTNVLGWGLGMVNGAFEVDVASRWSIALPIYYAGWNYFADDLKFRIFDIKPEVRYWLRPQKTGFFGGIHAGVSWYNFAFKGKYRYQNASDNRPAYGGGISIGYRLKIGKGEHWFVEFSAGAGAYLTRYKKIENEKNGKLLETLNKTYIGPDNASVSFGYCFNL